MKLLIEKANNWLNLVCEEEIASQIEDLSDAGTLPSEEEATETLQSIDPEKLKAIVARVGSVISENYMTVEEATFGESVKDIVNNLKGLADPKVIMAVIALMGVYNTADASKFTDTFFYNQEHIKQEINQELKDKIMEEFNNSPTASEGYAHVVVDGKDYFVGKGSSPVSKFAKEEAENNADKASLKAGDMASDKEVMNLQLLDYIETIGDEDKEAIIIMGEKS